MKNLIKVLALTVVGVFLFTTLSFAVKSGGFGTHKMATLEYIKSSGTYSTSRAFSYGRCIFYGIVGSTDGTNSVTLNVYDNSAGSGKELIPPLVIVGSDYYGGFVSPIGLLVETDIYIKITTSGTGYYAVLYDDGN